jgi:hypothetical protein
VSQPRPGGVLRSRDTPPLSQRSMAEERRWRGRRGRER